MKSHVDKAARKTNHSSRISAGFALALTLLASGAHAQTQPAEPKPAETKSGAETYQTLYLTNAIQQIEANDLVTDLRIMLPRARVYYVASQSAISIHANPDDMHLAQKMIADIDRPQSIYHLTYAITESDNGKRIGTKHFTLVLVSGGKTTLKEGTRAPVVTGTTGEGTATQSSQVQYLDVGLSIEASLDGDRLRTKVEQSSLADEKSGIGTQDPLIRQTTLEGALTLVPGKPLLLGSLDIPGSTHHQEIEVVSELMR